MSSERRIYEKFISCTENAKGTPTAISFKNTEKFNFAFDVVDGLAETKPDKLAMLHLSKDKRERRFTFRDISEESSRAANYFLSLGIKRGDRVMLVLKRHYQFWFCMLGLNKIGAIAISATNQLLSHDFEYRFESVGVSAIICTADGEVAKEAEIAEKNSQTLAVKIIVNGKREGWHSFDEEYAEC